MLRGTKPSTKSKRQRHHLTAFDADLSLFSGLRPMDPQREAVVDAWIERNRRKRK